MEIQKGLKTEQTCSMCKTVKHISLFAKRKRNGWVGAFSWCRECVRNNANARYKNPKTRSMFQNARLKSMYGITMNEFNEMVENQNGKCAICGINPYPKKLNIDHDHSTNKIRGLLCNKCNQAIGLFKEKIESLMAAIKYLTIMKSIKKETK